MVFKAPRGDNRNGSYSASNIDIKTGFFSKERLCRTEKRQLSEDEHKNSMDTVGKDQLLMVSSNTGTRWN